MKWFNTFTINLSFYVARTLTEAPRLKLVEKATFDDHSGRVYADSFSPDSRHMVIVSGGYGFTMLTMISLIRRGVWVEEDSIKNSWTEHLCGPCHKPQLHAIHFSPQGSPLVFTFCGREAKLITLNGQENWAEKATIEDVRFDSAIFSPEGRHLVATNRSDNKVHVFEIIPFSTKPSWPTIGHPDA